MPELLASRAIQPHEPVSVAHVVIQEAGRSRGGRTAMQHQDLGVHEHAKSRRQKLDLQEYFRAIQENISVVIADLVERGFAKPHASAVKEQLVHRAASIAAAS